MNSHPRPRSGNPGGGTARHIIYHEPTGVLWFRTDTHTIGRAVVVRQ